MPNETAKERRERIAIAMHAALVSSSEKHNEYTNYNWASEPLAANHACLHADALIARLDEEL